MATRHYENGIVSTSEGGSTYILNDIFVTGEVIYLNSVTGSDANAGTNRTLPKATLAGAIAVATASNGDVIVVESGHTESLGSSLALSKAGISIFGLGSGSAKPNFTVTAAVDGINISGANCRLYNLRFPVGTTATNTARINLGAAGIGLFDCDFLCGAQDLETITVPDAGDYCEINGCSFTISADGPDSAIKVESATTLGLKVIGCTFDGGSYDFDDAALYSAVAHIDWQYKDNILTNKASIIHTAAAKGTCSGTVAGDGSRVQI